MGSIEIHELNSISRSLNENPHEPITKNASPPLNTSTFSALNQSSRVSAIARLLHLALTGFYPVINNVRNDRQADLH